MRTAIFMLLFVVLCCQSMSAQTQELPDTTTMFTELPHLSEEFFLGQNFLSQEYNHDLKNKVSRLRMWSRDVAVAGAVSLFGVIMVNGFLAANNDWPLWVDIPCATVVSIAAMIPFYTWSSRLSKKADALEAQTASLWRNSRNIEVGMTHFNSGLLFNGGNIRSNNNWGLTLKASF